MLAGSRYRGVGSSSEVAIDCCPRHDREPRRTRHTNHVPSLTQAGELTSQRRETPPVYATRSRSGWVGKTQNVECTAQRSKSEKIREKEGKERGARPPTNKRTPVLPLSSAIPANLCGCTVTLSPSQAGTSLGTFSIKPVWFFFERDGW